MWTADGSSGQAMTGIQWIGVDWGTTNLRAYALGSDNSVIAVRESDQGMGRLMADAFEGALLDRIDAWLDPARVMPVIACGMVGARQGWVEAPYRAVPCAPVVAGELLPVTTRDQRIRLRIVPGLCQTTPPDVMRGEETQVAGFLAQNPDFEGALCLPGTHCKWVSVSAGRVTAFTTFMTGELFATLSTATILRYSLQQDGWDESAFVHAVRSAANDPGSLARELFGLRAAALLGSPQTGQARARLSGLLIGQELGLTRDIRSDAPVAIIGVSRLATLYRTALTALGSAAEIAAPEAATVAGLALAAPHTDPEAFDA